MYSPFFLILVFITFLGGINPGASVGAGPAIVVAQAAARSSSAALIFFCKYVVDDEDAKGTTDMVSFSLV